MMGPAKLPRGLGSIQRAVYLALLEAAKGLTFGELLDVDPALNCVLRGIVIADFAAS